MMKSRRRWQKRTQTGLASWQHLALKQPVSSSSSTAHSQETIKSETTGARHTNEVRDETEQTGQEEV